MVLHYLEDKKTDINVQKEGRYNSPGHDKNIYSPDKILHCNIYSFTTLFYIISRQINMVYVLLFTPFFSVGFRRNVQYLQYFILKNIYIECQEYLKK